MFAVVQNLCRRTSYNSGKKGKNNIIYMLKLQLDKHKYISNVSVGGACMNNHVISYLFENFILLYLDLHTKDAHLIYKIT